MNTNTSVDFFFNEHSKWQAEFKVLRAITLNCQLTEHLKWGVPTYTLQNRNIVLIHGFKDYCALLFFKGVLLTDFHNILIQQTTNVQSARQIRFTNLEQITTQEEILAAYINEAMLVEQAGLKVNFVSTLPVIPEEFQYKLNELPELKTTFYSLTKGRQREYLLYFVAAKQAKTKVLRIEKSIPQILSGKGLKD